MSIYGASKGAIAQLAKSTSLDYEKYNINVNCICPGTIETEKYFESINRKASMYNKDSKLIHESSEKLQPLRRNGKPIEIAHLVEFLISENSKFITGATIPIDGVIQLNKMNINIIVALKS
jgi:NAD(P)-dependent dehydrogenase (short-subunit alcohol dehydrogenase family)